MEVALSARRDDRPTSQLVEPGQADCERGLARSGTWRRGDDARLSKSLRRHVLSTSTSAPGTRPKMACRSDPGRLDGSTRPVGEAAYRPA